MNIEERRLKNDALVALSPNLSEPQVVWMIKALAPKDLPETQVKDDAVKARLRSPEFVKFATTGDRCGKVVGMMVDHPELADDLTQQENIKLMEEKAGLVDHLTALARVPRKGTNYARLLLEIRNTDHVTRQLLEETGGEAILASWAQDHPERIQDFFNTAYTARDSNAEEKAVGLLRRHARTILTLQDNAFIDPETVDAFHTQAGNSPDSDATNAFNAFFAQAPELTHDQDFMHELGRTCSRSPPTSYVALAHSLTVVADHEDITERGENVKALAQREQFANHAGEYIGVAGDIQPLQATGEDVARIKGIITCDNIGHHLDNLSGFDRTRAAYSHTLNERGGVDAGDGQMIDWTNNQNRDDQIQAIFDSDTISVGRDYEERLRPVQGDVNPGLVSDYVDLMMATVPTEWADEPERKAKFEAAEAQRTCWDSMMFASEKPDATREKLSRIHSSHERLFEELGTRISTGQTDEAVRIFKMCDGGTDRIEFLVRRGEGVIEEMMSVDDKRAGMLLACAIRKDDQIILNKHAASIRTAVASGDHKVQGFIGDSDVSVIGFTQLAREHEELFGTMLTTLNAGNPETARLCYDARSFTGNEDDGDTRDALAMAIVIEDVADTGEGRPKLDRLKSACTQGNIPLLTESFHVMGDKTHAEKEADRLAATNLAAQQAHDAQVAANLLATQQALAAEQRQQRENIEFLEAYMVETFPHPDEAVRTEVGREFRQALDSSRISAGESTVDRFCAAINQPGLIPVERRQEFASRMLDSQVSFDMINNEEVFSRISSVTTQSIPASDRKDFIMESATDHDRQAFFQSMGDEPMNRFQAITGLLPRSHRQEFVELAVSNPDTVGIFNRAFCHENLGSIARTIPGLAPEYFKQALRYPERFDDYGNNIKVSNGRSVCTHIRRIGMLAGVKSGDDTDIGANILLRPPDMFVELTDPNITLRNAEEIASHWDTFAKYGRYATAFARRVARTPEIVNPPEISGARPWVVQHLEGVLQAVSDHIPPDYGDDALEAIFCPEVICRPVREIVPIVEAIANNEPIDIGSKARQQESPAETPSTTSDDTSRRRTRRTERTEVRWRDRIAFPIIPGGPNEINPLIRRPEFPEESFMSGTLGQVYGMPEYAVDVAEAFSGFNSDIVRDTGPDSIEGFRDTLTYPQEQLLTAIGYWADKTVSGSSEVLTSAPAVNTEELRGLCRMHPDLGRRYFDGDDPRVGGHFESDLGRLRSLGLITGQTNVGIHQMYLVGEFGTQHVSASYENYSSRMFSGGDAEADQKGKKFIGHAIEELSVSETDRGLYDSYVKVLSNQASGIVERDAMLLECLRVDNFKQHLHGVRCEEGTAAGAYNESSYTSEQITGILENEDDVRKAVSRRLSSIENTLRRREVLVSFREKGVGIHPEYLDSYPPEYYMYPEISNPLHTLLACCTVHNRSQGVYPTQVESRRVKGNTPEKAYTLERTAFKVTGGENYSDHMFESGNVGRKISPTDFNRSMTRTRILVAASNTDFILDYGAKLEAIDRACGDTHLTIPNLGGLIRNMRDGKILHQPDTGLYEIDPKFVRNRRERERQRKRDKTYSHEALNDNIRENTQGKNLGAYDEIDRIFESSRPQTRENMKAVVRLMSSMGVCIEGGARATDLTILMRQTIRDERATRGRVDEHTITDPDAVREHLNAMTSAVGDQTKVTGPDTGKGTEKVQVGGEGWSAEVTVPKVAGEKTIKGVPAPIVKLEKTQAGGIDLYMINREYWK